jgi:hypothetical protein
MVNVDEFIQEELHEKYRLATWNLGNISGKPRKSVSRWPVAGTFGYILTSSEQFGKQI